MEERGETKRNVRIIRIVCVCVFVAVTSLFAQTNKDASLPRVTPSTNALEEIKLPSKGELKQEEVASFIKWVRTLKRPTLVELARLNKIPYKKNDTEEEIRKKILVYFFGEENIPVVQKGGSLEEIPRMRVTLDKGRVMLIHADNVERVLVMLEGGIQEEIVRLNGAVRLKIYDFLVSADYMVFSVTSDEVFGSGDVTVRSGEYEIFGEWFTLNRKTETGYLFRGKSYLPQEDLNVEGRVIKFKKKRFFADEGFFTTSQLNPPAYLFTGDKIYLWDEKKIMALGLLYKVGEQVFVPFPLFLQNYFGTGIHTSLGTSLREGFYIQNKKTIRLFGVDHHLRFDFYQKLGLFLGDTITLTNAWSTTDLNLMTAVYSRKSTRFSPYFSSLGDTRYVNYIPPDRENEFDFFRYKVIARQTLTLHKENTEATSLHWQFSGMSDLYFYADFERQKTDFDIIELLTKSIAPTLESITEKPVDRGYQNYLRLVNRGAKHSLTISSAWNVNRVRNLSVVDNIDNNLYMPWVSSIVLPSLSFSYGGVLGQATSTNDFPLNLSYRFNASYVHQIVYKNPYGVHFATNETFTNLTELEEEQEKLSEVSKEWDTLAISASFSRPFRFTVSSINPSLTATYRKQSTVSLSTDLQQRIADQNEDIRNTYVLLNAGYGANTAPFAKRMNWLTFGLNHTINYRNNEEDETTSFAGTHTARIVFPQALISPWLRHFILPSASATFTHAISYDLDDAYDSTRPYGGFLQHNTRANAAISLTGYGILLNPKNTLTLSVSGGTDYDLRIPYDAISNEYVLSNFVTNAWTERFRSAAFAVSGRGNIDMLFFATTFNYSLGYNFLLTNFTANRLNIGIAIPIPLKELVYFLFPALEDVKPLPHQAEQRSFSASVNSGIYFDFINYTKCYATFSFALSAQFDDLTIRLSTSSRNREIYRYFPMWSAQEGYATPKNVLSDLGNSFRFDNYTLRSESSFKLDGLSLQVNNNFDGWMMEFEFRVSPKTLSFGSVHTYFWDSQFSLKVYLKPYPKLGFPRQDINLNDDILDKYID